MTEPIAPCMKCEFVIVVGAEDLYSGADRHNKLMFAQSGIRYTKSWGPKFDRTTVFMFNGRCATRFNVTKDGAEKASYFKDGYTEAQIAATKASVERYGGIFSTASSWGDVAGHINNRAARIGGCEKYVQVLAFFCHGTPGRIWLANTRGEHLTADRLSAVSASSFLPEAALPRRYLYRHVTSWACQTANGAKPAETFEGTVSQSLAQQLADRWDINVRASATRTLYSAAFSTGISGRYKDLTGGRRMIDGCLWEDDGADGSVTSGPTGDHPNLQQGMWQLEPGQRSGYRRLSLD